jgi:hypothetical protein
MGFGVLQKKILDKHTLVCYTYLDNKEVGDMMRPHLRSDR